MSIYFPFPTVVDTNIFTFLFVLIPVYKYNLQRGVFSNDLKMSNLATSLKAEPHGRAGQAIVAFYYVTSVALISKICISQFDSIGVLSYLFISLRLSANSRGSCDGCVFPCWKTAAACCFTISVMTKGTE